MRGMKQKLKELNAEVERAESALEQAQQELEAISQRIAQRIAVNANGELACLVGTNR